MREDDSAMKKITYIIFFLGFCITIANLYPRQAACEETLNICNCETGVLDMEILSMATEMSVTRGDLINECAYSADSRKDFRRCISILTKEWIEEGLIDQKKRRAIRRCARQFMPVSTVKSVDVERYTGVWYQIASYISPFIGVLAGVTAEYTINPDGTVKVVNTGIIGGLDGTPVSIEGIARVVDEKTNAKLAVSFPDFGITEESEYWIIELGEDYSYAVVTNSKRSSLFILNRTPTMEQSFYQDLIFRLTMQCFDPAEIVRTPQPLE
jgi:apolipoprotein D and lipocalin family protein